MPKKDPNDDLLFALDCSDLERINASFEQGASIHHGVGTDKEPLIHALEHGASIQVVKLLLEKGARVDSVVKGRTVFISPLHFVAFRATSTSHEMLDLLLRHDKNHVFRSLQDAFGHTPYNTIRDAALKAHYDEVTRAEHGQVKGAWRLFRYFPPLCCPPNPSKQVSDLQADIVELEARGTDHSPAGTRPKTD